MSLDQQVNLELIKKIEVKQENFKLKLRTNGLNVSLPKDIAIAHINYYLDEISGDSNLTEQFDRQTEMKKLLLSNDEFEILNVYELDSFIKMDILEAIELQTNNTEYGFYYYFRDFFCAMLDNGDVSIKINNTYIDSIVEYDYSKKDKYSGMNSVRYYTPDTVLICECRPFLQYN